jgi:predicted RNA-binding protein YlxR (DUF448 family)
MKHRVYDSSGKRICIRMCVSCRENKPKSELIRIVKSPDGVVAIDEKSALAGRGAYVCKSRECIEKSRKNRGIERGIKAQVPKEIYEVLLNFEA